MSAHLIHKQKLVLHLSGSKDAFAVQNRVSKLLRTEVMQNLEALFNRLAPPGETIRIDRLELHLGQLSDQQLEEQFPACLLEKLEQEIRERLTTSGSPGDAGVFATRQSERDALCFFLQHGYLPWYKKRVTNLQWEQDLLAMFEAKDWTAVLQWLKKSMKPVVLQRLVYQFTDAFLLVLTEKTMAAEGVALPPLYSDVVWLLQQVSGLSADAARQKAWTFFLPQLITEQIPVDRCKAVAQFLQPAVRKEVLQREAVYTNGLKTALARDAFSQALLQAENAEDELLNCDMPQAEGSMLRAQSIERFSQSALEDEHIVSCCGLVLLHPFLLPLFDAVDLLNNRSFVDPEAHQRAVLLLHYLATGEAEAGEFELFLEKVLCGCPLEETLPVRFSITQKEKDEVAALLKAVITYWPPLKNTSAEGLQRTFLQRQGKLEKSEDCWRLIVEQKTVDILLGKLPWGFSTIRLPWMAQKLSVDWQ